MTPFEYQQWYNRTYNKGAGGDSTASGGGSKSGNNNGSKTGNNNSSFFTKGGEIAEIAKEYLGWNYSQPNRGKTINGIGLFMVGRNRV